MTPAQARAVLRGLAMQERPEPGTDPGPGANLHHRQERIAAAAHASRTRVEHLWRVVALPDEVLARMLAGGWDPRDRGGPPPRGRR